MDNQDKIFNKIKNASQKAEEKDFPAFEKVWMRVEEKLDKKEDKKAKLEEFIKNDEQEEKAKIKTARGKRFK